MGSILPLTLPFNARLIIRMLRNILNGLSNDLMDRFSTLKIRQKNIRTFILLISRSEQWMDLWVELKSVITFWIDQGVKIFRVDNPHTKPIPFWQWVIAEVNNEYPDIIFLAEAFTRPKIMASLAKVGFTQSYTYFTWRVHKQEIIEYMNELVYGQSRNYFRPNFWPNTPDILPISPAASG